MSGNVTEDELKAARDRVHDKDKKDFVGLVKKAAKATNIRVNKYIIKEVSDGFMLKLEIEKFLKGKSLGTRWVKGFLTEEMKKTLEKILDDIPRKEYVDTRDNVTRVRPLKMIKKYKEAPTELDLNKLWD